MCIPMGSGATPEDRGTQGLHKGTALASSARIVLFRRGRSVSRFGQKSILPISPFGIRRSNHLPSAVLITLSAPPGTAILALPMIFRMPNGQVLHPDHGRGLKPIYVGTTT